MDKHNKLDEILSHVERIGVIGSPSATTELALDIMGAAVGRKLCGRVAVFPFMQDGNSHYALGQITEIKLRNIWHEDSTIRSLIRQRGRIDAVSERQDTHQGEMTVSAVFAHTAKGYEPSTPVPVHPPVPAFTWLTMRFWEKCCRPTRANFSTLVPSMAKTEASSLVQALRAWT